ncbi:SusC/RagA family TonB-linked outer membrane protein [Salinimicrobium sp. TH3]|uniref:SusC/RagA family TonB-linked outer membrane protein n=1 Tax=Salinimicrobium sp. TH3 TaxID=2997342 RepID=UPI002274086A|nr:TonB-dependent receptor [Salinimicrobium sp. TH3]MCY2685519.1 TonB-dependent receptor [Salinimicrobium sp. TH3]
MNAKNSLLISFLVLLISFSANAQRIITGKVTAQDTGQPLIGANILVPNTNKGVVADFDGNFSIEVGEDVQALEVSYIGYKPQTIPLTEESNYEIQLESDKTLEEVVIVGYGTQERKDVSSSIQTIQSEEISKSPASSFETALQGQTPGVNISSASATPGSAININIRGVSSISASSQPLFIVDGVPLVSRNNSALNTNIQPTNPLADINPNDIKSITILKDAAAASIYGSRGANGVVLINTKRGKAGETLVNVGYYAGFSEITNTPDLVGPEQFKAFFNTAAEFDGLGPDYFDWIDTSNGVHTNIYDEIFRTGLTQNLDVSVRGGSEKTRFYLSGSLYEQEGIQIGQNFDRLSTRLNLDHDINSSVKIGTTIFLNRSEHDRTINENDEYGVIINAQGWDPTAPIRDENGEFTNPFNYNTWWPLENPVLIAEDYINDSRSTRVQASTFVEWDIIPDLTFRSAFSTEYSNFVEESFVPPGTNKSDQGEAIFATFEENTWQLENTLNYNRRFAQLHDLDLIAGWTLQETKAQFSDQAGVGFATNSTTSISAASTIINSTSAKNEYGLQSFFGRANYSFDNRYIFSFTLRADGSSRFGTENQYGYFPSASVAWRINEESFFDFESVSNLKLRASYGLTGNQEISSNWVGTYSLNAGYNNIPGIAPNRLENADLGWEKTKQLNLGLDFGLFNERFSITADYFKKQTEDLLLSADVPGLTGFSSVYQNIGEIQNTGFEFSLTADIIEGKNFNWRSGINFSLLDNEIIKLLNDGEIVGRNHILKEGESVSTLYLIKYEGVDPETGDALFEDVNGDGLINFDDRQIVGSALPDYFGGWQNTFSYKNFSLTANVTFSGGNKIYNQSRHAYENFGWTRSGIPYANISQRVFDNYWREPGQVTDVPRPSTESGQLQRFSTQFLEDGDYIRLKTLRLNYNLPSSVIDRIGMNNFGIYIQGQNLLTFTDYLGFDPEVSTNTSNQTDLNVLQGEDFGTLGQARTITIGFNATF